MDEALRRAVGGEFHYGIDGIDHADAVDREVIGQHLMGERAHGHGPDAALILCHGDGGRDVDAAIDHPFAAEGDFIGGGGAHAKSHTAIWQHIRGHHGRQRALADGLRLG